jgi:hypothetical protein
MTSTIGFNNNRGAARVGAGVSQSGRHHSYWIKGEVQRNDVSNPDPTKTDEVEVAPSVARGGAASQGIKKTKKTKFQLALLELSEGRGETKVSKM